MISPILKNLNKKRVDCNIKNLFFNITLNWFYFFYMPILYLLIEFEVYILKIASYDLGNLIMINAINIVITSAVINVCVGNQIN